MLGIAVQRKSARNHKSIELWACLSQCSELFGSLSQSVLAEMTKADKETGRSISIGMPIEKRVLVLRTAGVAYGLLPEGDAARKALARRFGTSASNSFGLFCAILALNVPAHYRTNRRSSWQWPRGRALRKVVSRGYGRWFTTPGDRAPTVRRRKWCDEALSFWKEKDHASVLSDNLIGLPRSGPTTRSLKPDLSQLKEAICCEHLCLKSASRIGIDVANVNLVKAEGKWQPRRIMTDVRRECAQASNRKDRTYSSAGFSQR